MVEIMIKCKGMLMMLYIPYLVSWPKEYVQRLIIELEQSFS